MAKKENVIPLLGEEWAEILWKEFNKPYMRYIMQEVSKDRKGSRPVYPPSEQVFRAYKETPYSKAKVCIIGQDPYHTPNMANGLCFSVNENVGVDIPPSLKNIFIELENDLGIDKHGHISHNPDLSRWAKQGVMLLNTSLTVLKGSAGSHSKLGWQTFTGKTIKVLSDIEGMIFVMWGMYAQSLEVHMNVMKNWFVKSSHPSPFSAHKGFFGSKPFSSINKLLKMEGKEEIKW